MAQTREIEALLFRQAALLDEKRWAEFIDLFTEDGVYWMPASPEQTTWDGVPSIFAEDRDLMTVRMKRLAHPHVVRDGGEDPLRRRHQHRHLDQQRGEG